MKCSAAVGAWLVFSTCFSACSPALDWRETAADGSGVVALFPCRPDRHARTVALGGTPLKMEMLVCPAAGATFALSFVDLPDPARVDSALAELRAVALANVRATAAQASAAGVAGMTPYAQAGRVYAAGQLPDGAAVQMQAVFFAKGLRVYQGSIIGAKTQAEATEIFFSGFRFPA